MICGKPGEVTQCPYRVPYSDCYCNLCWDLESIASFVWHELNPDKMKYDMPFPFLKSKEEIPDGIKDWELEEVKNFFRDKLKGEEND